MKSVILLILIFALVIASGCTDTLGKETIVSPPFPAIEVNATMMPLNYPSRYEFTDDCVACYTWMNSISCVRLIKPGCFI